LIPCSESMGFLGGLRGDGPLFDVKRVAQ